MVLGVGDKTGNRMDAFLVLTVGLWFQREKTQSGAYGDGFDRHQPCFSFILSLLPFAFSKSNSWTAYPSELWEGQGHLGDG